MRERSRSKESAARMVSVIGSTRFEDLERGEQFVDEELILTEAEQPLAAVDALVGAELIDDALR